eukprot:scaffold7813_cov309-Prasinococcus_capsulatus_cf.AAC.2
MWLVTPSRRSCFDYRQLLLLLLENELAKTFGHTEGVTTLVLTSLSEAKCSFWEAMASQSTLVVKRGRLPLPASITGTRRDGHVRVERAMSYAKDSQSRASDERYLYRLRSGGGCLRVVRASRACLTFSGARPFPEATRRRMQQRGNSIYDRSAGCCT